MKSWLAACVLALSLIPASARAEDTHLLRLLLEEDRSSRYTTVVEQKMDIEMEGVTDPMMQQMLQGMLAGGFTRFELDSIDRVTGVDAVGVAAVKREYARIQVTGKQMGMPFQFVLTPDTVGESPAGTPERTPDNAGSNDPSGLDDLPMMSMMGMMDMGAMVRASLVPVIQEGLLFDLSPRGTVLYRGAVDLPFLSGGSIHTLYGFLDSLPLDPIAVGTSWSYEYSETASSSGIAGMTGNFALKVRGTTRFDRIEERGGHPCAILVNEFTLGKAGDEPVSGDDPLTEAIGEGDGTEGSELPSTAPANPFGAGLAQMLASVSVTGEGKGETVLDLQRGVVISSNLLHRQSTKMPFPAALLGGAQELSILVTAEDVTRTELTE